MPNEDVPSNSLRKKRARDRRAQQNVRNRREARLRSLEQQVSALEAEVQNTHQTCRDLREENQAFRSHQDYLQQLVIKHTVSIDSAHQNIFIEASATRASAGGMIEEETHAARHSQGQQQVKLEPLAMSPLSRVDINGSEDFMSTLLRPWISRPDLVRASPNVPRPTEILYGSKTNFLAHCLHQGMRAWPWRDPERLALGWIAYSLIKWMVEPSVEWYLRLHCFQRPIQEQLDYPHSCFIDFIVWPQLRSNLIKHQYKYDTDDVAGILTCCIKTRWPWNKPILVPDNEGHLQLEEEFYNTFTVQDGWALTEDFINRYPELVDGLDKTRLQYRFD